MKTPFDPVVRMRQRALDALSPELAAAAVRVALAEAALEDHEADVRREIAARAASTPVPTGLWFARAGERRAELAELVILARTTLDDLRGAAARLLGERRAFEQAAERMRADRRRLMGQRQQIALDEMSARIVAVQ